MPTNTPCPTQTQTPTPTTDPDPDLDGMPSWEKQVYETDPAAAQDWAGFDFVYGVLNTPRKNSVYMMNHLRYIPDPPENPNYTAVETFQRGGGDCEDLAAFPVHNLRRAGVAAWVFDVQWGELDSTTAQGHAVGAYFDGASYWYIGTDPRDVGEISGPFQDPSQMATHISPSW